MKKLILTLLTIITIFVIPVSVSALEEVNLSVGKPYIRTAAYLHPNYPDTDNIELTDGNLGNTNIYGSAWSGTYHRKTQTGKTYDEYPLYDVTIDLGSVNSITSVKANFLRDPETAIYLPWSYDVWASVDGENWMQLSYYNNSNWDVPKGVYSFGWQVPANDCGVSTNLTDEIIKARYVRYVFETYQAHNFIDEITVMGYEGEVENAVAPYNTEVLDGDIRLADETTGNVQDMVLMYQSTDWTYQKLLPYLTYIDGNGTPKDTLFDTFCMLKLTSTDGSNLAGPKSDMTLADWTEYINEIFSADDADVKVLNETAKQVSLDLDDPDYKANLVIMIPFPTPQATSFGTLNGRSLDLSVEADWKYLIDWYLQKIVEKFESGNYEYLDFKGFYWVNESPDSKERIRYFTSKVREMGYKSYWIPFFHSVGYFWNEDLGFDAVTVQPNHYFGEVSDNSLGGGGETIVNTIMKMGAYGNFGIEMEMDFYLSNDITKYNLFLDYINAISKAGFQGEGYFRNWYEAGGCVYKLATDKRPQIRRIYDNIYQVVKGTYTPREYLTSYGENLLLGKKYTHNVDCWYKAEADDTNCVYLTDGETGGKYTNSNYFGAYRREPVIFFDFDEKMDMREIHTELYVQTTDAIRLPGNLDIYIKPSENSDWVNIYSGNIPEAYSIFRADKNFETYGLKFVFSECSSYTFIKEILAYEYNTNTPIDASLDIPVDLGDLNQDTKVNEDDFKLLSDYFAGFDADFDEKDADINKDGKIDRVDLLKLAKIVTNL